jgi:regulatory protein
VHGEHPSARRRSGRRTRGRRAATGPDLADSDLADPGLTGPDLVDPDLAGPDVPAQPAWSDEWTAEERSREQEQRREQGELDDPEERARQICLRQLSLAPKTRAQLHEVLAKRDIPADVADVVLSRFADVGLIDDAAFAKAWVESRHYSKGLAGRALKAELRRRGVADDDIKEAVDTLDPDAEVETARRLVARKLASTKGQPAETRTRRMAGMLARKGYPAGLAFRVIREALESEAESEAEAGAAAFDETQAFFGDEPPIDPSDDEYASYTE